MKYTQGKRNTVLFIAFPLKQWWQRLSVIFFLIASIALLVAGRMNYPIAEQWRTWLADTILPIKEAVFRPVEAVQMMGRSVTELLYLQEENTYLEKELAKARREAMLNQQIAAENNQLKELLHFVGVQEVSFLTARVVADTSGPFLRSVMINAGKEEGVHKGNAVINENGIVGRVVEVGKHTSRVLLVTDINSRIPVIMENSRDRAIISGNNSQLLDVLYLPRDTMTKAGELAITSGDGKYFPSGLPVGRVGILQGHKRVLQPLMDWSQLEYVSVIKQ